MMKIFVCTLLLFFYAFVGLAQNQLADSLFELAESTIINDSLKAERYLQAINVLVSCDLDKVEEIFQENKTLFQNNKTQYSKVLIEYGWSLLLKNEFEQAETLLKEGVLIAPDSVSYYLSTFYLSYLHFSSLDLQKAEAGMKKSLKFFQSKQNNELALYVYIGLGNLYFTTSENDLAIENYLKVIQLDEPNSYNVRSAQHNLAQLYLRKGDIAKAIECFEKNINIIKEVECNPVDVYLLASLIYQHLRENEKAMQHILKAREMTSYVDNSYLLIDIDLALLKMYYNKGEIKKAKSLFQNNLLIYNQKAHRYLQPEFNYWKALIAIEENNFNEARDAIDDLFDICLLNNLPYFLTKAFLLKGQIAIAQNDTSKAKEVTQKALNVVSDIDNPFLLIECNKQMVKIMELISDPNIIQFKSDLFKAEDTLVLTTSGELLAIEKIDELLTFLNPTETEEKHGNDYFLFSNPFLSSAFVLGISVLSVVFALFFLYKTSQHNISLVKDKENIASELSKAEEEKDILQKLVESKESELKAQNISHLKKSNEIKSIEKEIDSLKKSSPNELKKELYLLSKKINNMDDRKEAWKKFQTVFETQYPRLIPNLLNINADLTQNDLKNIICIRLNLSVKESAGLLSTSEAAVTKARQRLKKKLGLEKDVKLSSFVLNVSKIIK